MGQQQPMTDAEFRAFLASSDIPDMDAERLRAYVDSLTLVEATPEQTEQLIASLPPAGDGPLNVVRTIRLPEDLHRRLDRAAEDKGIPSSTFIRRAIESALAGHDKTNLVNVDDVIRAVRSLPPAAAA